MANSYVIAPCSGLGISVRAGQRIRLTDLEGGQVLDFFAQLEGQPEEHLSTGVTMDCNESLKLRPGDLIYSNRYRPMLKLLQDDVGEHDLLHPCCRREMYDFFYHNGVGHPNCLDNINQALGTNHALIQPVNFFMHTRILPDGSFRVEPPLSRAGDSVELEALLDLRLGMAACSVSESSCNSGRCTAVQVDVLDAGE